MCENITAPMDLPAFDNSAMDGYAVYFDDVVGASEDHPVHLPVVGEMAAGQTKLFALSPGTAVRIMTGAPVPQGADAIVPVEWTDGGVASVRITQAPQLDQHVRHQGEDVQAGDVLLEDGSILGPAPARAAGVGGPLAGPLAPPAAGRDHVDRRGAPRARARALGHDSIYDANSYMLAAAARTAGAIAYRVGIVSDDPNDFRDALSDQLVRADLVVTSGGVSKGDYDVVKEVLSELGTVWFGEVGMQPGKPQGFGFVGEDSTPIFTLPGNPVSSYVSFEVFVVPAIRRMMGRLPYRRPMVRALCSQGFASIPGRQQYVRAQFEIDGKGAHVAPVGGHGSHLVGDLSEANALIVGAARGHLRAGRQPGAGARARPGLLMSAPDERLTHVDETGAARMVDVSAKDVTSGRPSRPAGCSCRPTSSALLRGEGVPKGDALGVARVAGIMAAKRTPDLVPLCHPLAISGVTVDLVVADDAVEITATVRTTDRTGVEMEALTAVSVAGADRRGHGQGRRQGRGHHRRARGVEDRRQVRRLVPAVKATVVCASNRAAAGVYEDTTGPLIVEALTGLGFEVTGPVVVPDGEPVADAIRAAVDDGCPRRRHHRRHRPHPDRPDARGDPAAARPGGARHRRGDPGVRRRQGRPHRGAVARARRRPRAGARREPAGLPRGGEGRPRRARPAARARRRADHRERPLNRAPENAWRVHLRAGRVGLRPLATSDARAWNEVRRRNAEWLQAVGGDRPAR